MKTIRVSNYNYVLVSVVTRIDINHSVSAVYVVPTLQSSDTQMIPVEVGTWWLSSNNPVFVWLTTGTP